MITAGLDAGARALKVVLWDTDRQEVVASAAVEQSLQPAALARETLEGVLKAHGLTRAEVQACVATGYARHSLTEAEAAITEITCHARGVYHLRPDARTIIEVGGQDSKVLSLDGEGAVRDFVMNDRCAAGSGRFLELLAGRLGLSVGDLGRHAAASQSPVPINATCAVFAENEITGLLATGADPAGIAAGVLAALAVRLGALVGNRARPAVVLTGGVARVAGLAEALQEVIGERVTVAPTPQFTGALGAALLAAGVPSGAEALTRGR